VGDGRFAVVAGADSVFYDGMSQVIRAGLDGSDPTPINGGMGTAYGLALDEVNGVLYWSDFNNDIVQSFALDSGQVDTVMTGITSPSGLAVDSVNGKLYVITYNQTQLVRSNLDGTERETLLPNLGGQGVAVAVEPSLSRIYYTLRNDNVYTANLDGSDATVMFDGQVIAQGVDTSVDLNLICWSAPIESAIRCADLDTGANQVDAVGTGNAWHISILD
jgi:sugar lactone lactonase YvrE